MSKGKPSKKNQHQLTPQEFIKTKARSFPIFKCYINRDWKDQGLANIIISRQQTNSKFVIAVYLVDLYCMGVKDTFWNINLDKLDLDHCVRNIDDANPVIEIDYILAHNIIYAAIEYAEDLGFYPHQDYLYTTKHVLEEDSDLIEYVEVECGENGRPHFVMSDFYNSAQKKVIIKQLEKSVGIGNFDVTEIDNSEEEMWAENFDELTPEERRDLFLELGSNEDELIKNQNLWKLIELTNSIYINDICDLDQVDQLFDKWNEEINIEVDDDQYLIESFGMEKNLFENEDVQKLLQFENNVIDDESNNEIIKQIMEKHSNVPYFYYLNIILLTKQEKYDELNIKMSEYIQLFPDYALLQIENIKNQIRHNKKVNSSKISFNNFFKNRTGITHYEMFQYQLIKQLVDVKPHLFDSIQACCELYEILDLKKEYLDVLNNMLLNTKIQSLDDHFKMNK